MSTKEHGAFEQEDQTHRQAVALALAAHARAIEPQYVTDSVRDQWLTDADVVIAVLRARGWTPPPAGRDLAPDTGASDPEQVKVASQSWALELAADGRLFPGWLEQSARHQYERGTSSFSALFCGSPQGWVEVERRRPAPTRQDT